MTHRDPLLFTPGPLTTATATKQAMLRDWGSRDPAFGVLNASVRDRLVALANGGEAYTCVPIQGSGTFAVEAMLATFVPRDGKVLLVVNGAYGHRMAKICEYAGRACQIYETAEDRPPEAAAVDRRLTADPAIGHVAIVQCETTSGILNPLADIAAVVRDRGRRLLVDAMSAFGALPADAAAMSFDALAASANKCLEGVPGLAFVICRKDALAAAAGNAHSLSLDLYDQWSAMEKTGQWRFTPPTHVVAALAAALDAHEAEGGAPGRYARYRRNCDLLVTGMRALGFEPLLPADLQAPIIVTFHMPADRRFDFSTFYDRLNDRGFVIYPGKLTVAETFRIGCIGHLDGDDVGALLEAVGQVLAEMKVEIRGRAAA